MRKTVLIIALGLISGFAFGQKKPPVPPPEPPLSREAQQEKLRFKCLHTDKYTAAERRSFFPFATASKIMLISFDAYRLPDPIYSDDGKLMPVDDTDPMPLVTPIAPNRFVLNYRKVKEQKTLNAADIDRLTDILYNVGYTPVKGLTYEPELFGGCYNPRNAIVFLDAKGNVTQYIELCFHCQGHSYSSSKTKHIEYCEQKYDLLNTFFSSKNIQFGTL